MSDKTIKEIKYEIKKLKKELHKKGSERINNETLLCLAKKYKQYFEDVYNKEYTIEIALPLIIRVSGLMIDDSCKKEQCYFEQACFGIQNPSGSTQKMCDNFLKEYLTFEDSTILNHFEKQIYNDKYIVQDLKEKCQKAQAFYSELHELAKKYEMDLWILLDDIIEKYNKELKID